MKFSSIKVVIFVFLLCWLVGISVFIFMNNAKLQTEEFSATNSKPLKWDYIEELQSASYIMTQLERQKGMYIVKDIRGGGVVKLLKVKLPYGYYRVDDTTMAQIPYGYMLEPQGDDMTIDYTKRIVPKTNTAAYESKPTEKPMAIPNNGEIPDGMYMLPDKNTMALLPPGMKPLIKSLLITGSIHNPILKKTYDAGYLSEAEYYSKKFPVDVSSFKNQNGAIQQIAVPLPPELYYSENQTDTDLQKNTTLNVQFLQYGKIAKMIGGIISSGYVDNPNLISKTGKFDYTKSYSTIQNNYDVQYHDTIDTLKQQNDMYDLSFGSVSVLDQTGNLIVLPRSQVQGDITFYRPDAYMFGASTYVPKYEDSVYLSRTSHMPSMSEYRSAFKTVGFCEENKHSDFALEEKCNALDAEKCASTACCTLLGGSKCVAGNATGPTMKQNYSDIFVRNKDYYTHMGKCYGNCP